MRGLHRGYPPCTASPPEIFSRASALIVSEGASAIIGADLPVSGGAASGRGKTACDAHPGRGGLPVTRAITAGRGAVLAHDAGQLAGVGGLVAVIYKGLDRTRDVAGA